MSAAAAILCGGGGQTSCLGPGLWHSSTMFNDQKLDARMVRTQQALRDALLVLVGMRPLDDITIRDIVAKAGIGYATFFRHFPSKAALLETVVADEIARLVDLAMPALARAGTRASSIALFSHVDSHRGLWRALLTGGAAGTIREEFAKAAIERAAGFVKKSHIIPTELGVLVGVTATVQIIAWWLKQGDDFPVERIAEIHDKLVTAPSVAAANER